MPLVFHFIIAFFKVDSIARDLNIYLLSDFVCNGVPVKGVLIDHIWQGGFSPCQVAFNKSPPVFGKPVRQDGVVDSLRLRGLVFSAKFNIRSPKEHLLAQLILQCF